MKALVQIARSMESTTVRLMSCVEFGDLLAEVKAVTGGAEDE
jgi:hypothetical protein